MASTPAPLAHTLLWEQPTDSVTVSIPKPMADSRVGLALWHALPKRAVVYTVHPGSLSHGAVAAFDEVLSINGVAVESALQAVATIREAAAGQLVVVKRGCPARLHEAARKLQRRWAVYLLRHFGIERVHVEKPTKTTLLGVAFAPEFTQVAYVKAINPEGAAAAALAEGDLLLSINGVAIESPSEAARQLREAAGTLTLTVQHQAFVDEEALLDAEDAADAAAAAAEEAEGEEESWREGLGEEGDGEEFDGYSDDDLDGEETVPKFSGYLDHPAWLAGQESGDDDDDVPPAYMDDGRPPPVAAGARCARAAASLSPAEDSPPNMGGPSAPPGARRFDGGAAAGKRLHKPAAMPAPAAAALPLQATTTRTTNSAAAEYSPRAKAGSWKEWLAQRQIRMSSTAQTAPLPTEVAAPSVQRV